MRFASAPPANPGVHRLSVLRCYPVVALALASVVLAPVAAAQTVAEVQVTPETMTLGVGQKQAIFATAYDQRGNLIPSAKFTFWSSDSLVALVKKDGTVTGLKPGLAKIEARSQGRRASLAVLITGGAATDPPTASSASILTLEPASLSLYPGETAKISARAQREDGTPVSAGRVTIKSLKPEIVRVDSGGFITGVAVGRTIVQASSGRLMATLPVEVAVADFALSPGKLYLAPDEVDTVRAVVPSQSNREIRGAVQWRSSDTAVVTVAPGGVVRGNRAGQAEVVASAFSQERRATVTVHRVPDALVVSPHQGGMLQVPLRSTRQFTAVAESADSTPIPEAHITWELSDTSVASFDRVTGTLTPKSAGTTTLTARLPGITPAVWTIQVVAGDITVEPSRVSLLVGQRASLSAMLREPESSGSTRTPSARWSSDKPDVAAVRENGQVDAVGLGHALVSATMPWGKKATADIFVVGDLFLSSNRGGGFGIYQMRAPGPPTLVPVVTDSGSNIQAVLSPDRTRLAFSSNRSGSYDLYVSDPDGGRPRRLTSAPGNEGEPAWTPDGSKLVYTATTGTNTQIAIIPVDGGESRQLTIASAGNHSPSLSPDGRTIVFVSARDGNHAIYTMGIDGTSQRRLTRGSARETSPRYARNGDLFYVVERGGGSKGSRVMRLPAGGGGGSQMLQTEDPISALAISREGDRLVYLVGRVRDAAKGRVEFSLFLQPLQPGRPSAAIPLQPGEQISSPSF